MTDINTNAAPAATNATPAWSRFWFRPVSPQSLGLLRLFFGMVLVGRCTGGVNPWTLLRDGLHFPKRGMLEATTSLGLPWLSELSLPELSAFGYRRMDEALLILGVLIMVGLGTRVVVPLAAILLSYLFLLGDLGSFQSLSLTLVVLWVLSFSACGEYYSVDALLRTRRRPRTAMPAWPLRVIQLAVCGSYVLMVLTQLNAGWLSGDSIVSRDAWRLGGWFTERCVEPIPTPVRALAVLIIPALLAVLLWLPRWRILGIWIGVWFHLLLDMSVGVGAPGYLTMVSYIAFLSPASGATVVLYDGYCSLCQRSRSWTRLGDWLGRLSWLDMREPDVAAELPMIDVDRLAAEMHVVTPDGRILVGFDGWRCIVSSMPLTFLPSGLLYLPPVRSVGNRVYRMIADRRRISASCQLATKNTRSSAGKETLTRARARYAATS